MALKLLLLLVATLLLVSTKAFPFFPSNDEEYSTQALTVSPSVPVPVPAPAPAVPVKAPTPAPLVKPSPPPPAAPKVPTPSPPVNPPTKPMPKIRTIADCVPLCGERCKAHSRPNVCQRACKTCCVRCKCVPPGTYGNREMCGTCYTSMMSRNRPKCP
ncbi:gibberellin-regulated protein 14-like [Tripterygium wilfordii]|uniref:gibberellin-regulated protein 14-like n=1 Tax=Tripterygium wilfordii TaxID=458696 RepID=UPI0018F7EDCE|nr:gibberellin-regulated protein 14-like [Tripterygium wilfordii]